MADDKPTTPTDAPPELDLDKVLNWDVETDGELPPEYTSLPLDKVKEHVATATERAATAERGRALEAERTRQAAAQAETERRATLQSDIDWADDLKVRLTSDDEAVRKTAQFDEQNNADRYVRGLAAKHQASEEAVQQRVLAGHYTPLIEGLNAAGYSAFTTTISDRLVPAGGNTLLAAVEFGKELGDAAGYSRGVDETARAGRIAAGQMGSPDLGGGQPGPSDLVPYHQLTTERRMAMSPAERDNYISRYGG